MDGGMKCELIAKLLGQKSRGFSQHVSVLGCRHCGLEIYLHNLTKARDHSIRYLISFGDYSGL